MKILVMCKPYLIKYIWGLVTYLSISLIAGIFMIINPFIIGSFIDALVDGGTMNDIFVFSMIFACISIVRIIFNFITMILYTKIQTKSAHEFSQDAVAHLQKLPLSFFNKKDTDYISQVINGDTNMLTIFCINIGHSFILNGIYFIIPLSILFFLNSTITLILLSFIAIYAIIYLKFRKPLFERSMGHRIVQNQFFSKLLEQLKLTKFIKIHELSNTFRKRMDNYFFKLIGETLKMQKLNFAYASLDTFVNTIAQIVLFLLGGYFVLTGNFTVGMFTMFTMYFNMMIGSAKFFFDFGKKYQDNLVSYSRIQEILSSPIESNGRIKLTDIECIEVKNLCFSYTDSEHMKSIRNLNYKLKKGNIYGVKGHNGAGKSTLINLLLGMHIDEIHGDILINNQSIRNLDMHDIRKKHVGVAEQNPVILNDTLEYNTKLEIVTTDSCTNKSTTIEKYFKMLNMEKHFSSGADSDNKDVLVFSGGEKQKLCILRLLLKNPFVMIFDEPTSSLDSKTVSQFITYLNEIKGDKIIIIVTHDNLIYQICDYVLSL